jgi:hypothetical protein
MQLTVAQPLHLITKKEQFMKVKLYTILLTILIIGCTIKKEIPADIEFTV